MNNILEKLLTHPKWFTSFLIGIFLPITIVSFVLFQKQTRIKDLQAEFEKTLHTAKVTEKKRKMDKDFIDQYSTVNPYYIDQVIEPFCFLQNEKKLLEPLLSHPAFQNVPSIKDRYDFINGKKNKLRFIEDAFRSSSSIKEVEMHQKKGIELDEKDLIDLLTLIEENNNHDKPQLLITSFSLEKKKKENNNEVFILNLDLLKREFIQQKN